MSARGEGAKTAALILFGFAVLGLLALALASSTLNARRRLRERNEAERQLTCILTWAEVEPKITVAAAQFGCTPYRP